MSANHAGGYAYRLCKADTPGGITESCFRKGHLSFANASPKSYAAYPDGTRDALPTGATAASNRRDVVAGAATSPEHSEWARVPVPTCRECASAYDRCGAPLLPTPGLDYGSQWNAQVNCYASCAGSESSAATGFCPDATQFSVSRGAASAYSGYGKSIWEWSILDTVEVPADLEPGAYVLSWRWDCEQSAQVWQNCADVEIVALANQTRWDKASAAALAEVPAVTRGGESSAATGANERCMNLLALCRTDEASASEACGRDRVDATCADGGGASAAAAGRRNMGASSLFVVAFFIFSLY
jgi:hypothetical protein